MNDEFFMEIAIQLAKKAYKKGEVPIGALIVKDGKIISKSYNRREKSQNAITHAEITAIYKACKKLKSWRLDGCTMFVTLEPCPMCAGAIVNSRLKRVVFGAYELKSGAVCSKFNLLKDSGLNHSVEFSAGVKLQECQNLIKQFFSELRKGEKYINI